MDDVEQLEVFEPRPPPSILEINRKARRGSIYPKKDIIEENKIKLEENTKKGTSSQIYSCLR